MQRLHRSREVHVRRLPATALIACFFPLASSPSATAQGVQAPRPPAPLCRPAPLVAPSAIPPYSAVPSPAWTDLFDRTSGWTGADGVYAIPLVEDDRPCGASAGETYFTFSDTFIGTVDDAGKRSGDTTIINNTQGRLRGSEPVEEALAFSWDTGPAGEPLAALRPDTAMDEFFWPLDGLVEGGELVEFALRMAPSDGPFGFAIVGVSQVVWTIDAGEPFATYTQTVTPLFQGLDSYGRAVLPNTVSAQAPVPDGHVYVYGLRENPLDKELLVARVPAGSVQDFSAYRFWDGNAWSTDLTDAAAVVDRLSSEFSVSALEDGRFLLTYQQDDFLGPDVTVRLGASPVGPFDPVVPIYAIPTQTAGPQVFAYGAKAHGHLSRPDRLLISYHVNTFDFAAHFENADIYRPRFLELALSR